MVWSWRVLAVGALALIGAHPALAQLRVRRQDGAVHGRVIDSLTQAPVPYALIILPSPSRRLFAAESGRFTLAGLDRRTYRIRVQQIGYAAVEADLAVVDDADAPGTVTLVIARRRLELPEIVVHGDPARCTPGLAAAAAEGGVMERVRANVDRIATLEHEYPFEVETQHLTQTEDVGGNRHRPFVRRYTAPSRHLDVYRAGEVVNALGLVQLMSVSDVARSEFQKHHCFWYAGTDSIGETPVDQVRFVPDPGTTSPDWEGTLSLDAATSVLRRAEISLIHLREKAPVISSVCVVDFTPIAPTLVVEGRAACRTTNRNPDRRVVLDIRTLENYRFLKRKPGEP